jgi:hypothetical protein
MPAIIPPNLGPESMPWARDLGSRLETLEGAMARSAQSVENASQATSATIAALAGQITSLNATITRLNGLTTLSATGADFNTGTTPGDSTFRWFNSTPALTLQTPCPTGKLLVTVGTGECTLQAGNSSAVAAVSFSASTPSGWTYALDNVDSRIFLGPNGYLGLPLVVNAPIVGVPTTETVTITVQYGIWSSSGTTLASAEFASNYVIAQVTN